MLPKKPKTGITILEFPNPTFRSCMPCSQCCRRAKVSQEWRQISDFGTTYPYAFIFMLCVWWSSVHTDKLRPEIQVLTHPVSTEVLCVMANFLFLEADAPAYTVDGIASGWAGAGLGGINAGCWCWWARWNPCERWSSWCWRSLRSWAYCCSRFITNWLCWWLGDCCGVKDMAARTGESTGVTCCCCCCWLRSTWAANSSFMVGFLSPACSSTGS